MNYDLPLTGEEVQFLLNCIGPHMRWPQPHDTQSLLEMPGQTSGGGPVFRLKVIALRQYMKAHLTNEQLLAGKMLPLEVTPADLWFLDSALQEANYAQAIGPTGKETVGQFLEKVWTGMIDAGIDKIDQRYLPSQPPIPAEVLAKQQRFLAEIDDALAHAEATADGSQYEIDLPESL